MSRIQKKVIVGMSGGVDSSVSALILMQQGYHVEGLFMKNWEEDDTDDYCSASSDYADAQAVCDRLGIHLHSVNFSKTYWDHVFTHFLREYQAGRTPNPDILCNKEIKFKAFLEHAQSLEADFIATGHYAKTDHHLLRKGVDAQKDQSYFLYTLNTSHLSRTLFPLGDLLKTQIRNIANEAGFINHAKKDSTGICFIGERRFKEFLSQYLPAKPGPIETLAGEKIGQHDGLMYYTLGQRKGIGIGGLDGKEEQPWFVAHKDLEKNTLVVVQGHDHLALFRNELQCQQLHWVSGTAPTMPLHCMAKTRYRQVDVPCTVHAMEADTLHVIFPTPQRAITPGQSIVFYEADICLGGGVIMA